MLVYLAGALGVLTGITTVSTLWMSISNPVIAVALCIGAALLDLYKYAAYPLAFGLLDKGRQYLAYSILGAAFAFTLISGYATFNRVSTALAPSATNDIPVLQEKLNALTNDVNRLTSEVSATKQYADKLAVSGNLKGSQAKENEAVKLQQELSAVTKDRISVMEELSSVKNATPFVLPALLVAGLALLFSLSLELVPVLILLANRKLLTSATLTVSSASSEDVLYAKVKEYLESVQSGQKVIVTSTSKGLSLSNEQTKVMLEKAKQNNILKKEGKFYVKA